METERLLVRKPQPADAAQFLPIRNSAYVLRYNGMREVSQQELEEEIAKGEGSFYLELKATNQVIGAIDLEADTLRHKVNATCISYYLGEAYAGKGYMSEAVLCVMRYAFCTLGYEIMALRAFEENEASLRLAKRLGFVYEGRLRHAVKGYGDVIHNDMLFSMTAEEFIQKYGE